MSTVTFDSSAGLRAIVVADEGAAGRSHLDHAMAALGRAEITLALTLDVGGGRTASFALSPEELRRISTLSPTARQFEALRDRLSASNSERGEAERLTPDQINEGAARLLARLGQLDGHLGNLNHAAVSLRIGLGDAAAPRPDDTLVVRGDHRRAIHTAPVVVSTAPTIERPTAVPSSVSERSAPVSIDVGAASTAFAELLRLADAGSVAQLNGGSTMAWLDPSQVEALRPYAALFESAALSGIARDPARAAQLLQLMTRAFEAAGMSGSSEAIARQFLAGGMPVGAETTTPTAPAADPLAALPAPMRAAVAQLRSQLTDLRSHRELFPQAATECVLETGDALLAAIARGETPTAEQLRGLRDALVGLDSRLSGVVALAAHPRLEAGIRELDTMLADTSATVRHFPQSFAAMLLDILLEIFTLSLATTRWGDGAVERPRWQQAGRRLAASGGDEARSHVAPPATRAAATSWLQTQIEAANPWMSSHPTEARRAAETMYDAMTVEYRRGTTAAPTTATAEAPPSPRATTTTATTTTATTTTATTTTATTTTASTTAPTGDARPITLSQAQRTELESVRALLRVGVPAAEAPLDALLNASPPTIAHARAFAAAIRGVRDRRPADYARLLRGIQAAGGTLDADDTSWLARHPA